MTWFTDSNNQTESAKPHNLLVVAIDGDFPSGHVRLSSWTGPLTINGNVFTGAAGLGRMPTPSEDVKLVADTRTYQLSGVDPSVVPESEIDGSFARSWTEYLVWLNPSTYQIVGFEISFEGRMDKFARRDGGASPIIEVNVENRLVILDQADGHTYTTTTQSLFFPGAGDTGFDHVKENDSVTILWGAKFVQPGIINPPNWGVMPPPGYSGP